MKRVTAKLNYCAVCIHLITFKGDDNVVPNPRDHDLAPTSKPSLTPRETMQTEVQQSQVNGSQVNLCHS